MSNIYLLGYYGTVKMYKHELQVSNLKIYRHNDKQQNGTAMGYYTAIKSALLPFAAVWLDVENIILSEISQRQKVKYCMISLVWNIKNKINEYICKTETDSDIENKHVVTKRER